MDKIRRNKADSFLVILLTLILGACFGAYILANGSANYVSNPDLPNVTVNANYGIMSSGLNSLGLVGLGALVVTIGYLIKAI